MSWVKNTSIAMEYVIRQTGPYKKQCIALEKIFLTKKEELLEDVDGSQWQFYVLGNGEIVVRNDCCINELYIESDVDLIPYFNR